MKSQKAIYVALIALFGFVAWYTAAYQTVTYNHYNAWDLEFPETHSDSEIPPGMYRDSNIREADFTQEYLRPGGLGTYTDKYQYIDVEWVCHRCTLLGEIWYTPLYVVDTGKDPVQSVYIGFRESLSDAFIKGGENQSG